MKILNKRKSNVPRRGIKNSNNVGNFSDTDTFKRNRTLTGLKSKNNVTFSNDSPRTKKRYLSIQRRKVAGLLIIVVASIILIWIFVTSLIANVNIVPNSTVSKQVDHKIYEDAIQDYLNNNPIDRFTFITNQASLSAYVSKKYPEVQDIKFHDIKGLGEVSFKINMRVPVAGWLIENKQYYVDSNGIPFETNYYSEHIVQIVDNSGIPLHTSNSAIASHKFLSFIGRVVHLSKTYGYTVVKATLPSNTTRELDIKLKKYDYVIKLSIDRQAGEQIEDMHNSIGYFEKFNLKPKYIDVRVSGKAFYI